MSSKPGAGQSCQFPALINEYKHLKTVWAWRWPGVRESEEYGWHYFAPKQADFVADLFKNHGLDGFIADPESNDNKKPCSLRSKGCSYGFLTLRSLFVPMREMSSDRSCLCRSDAQWGDLSEKILMSLDDEVDQAISLCGGHVRATLLATLLANAFLEAEVERLSEAVSPDRARKIRRRAKPPAS